MNTHTPCKEQYCTREVAKALRWTAESADAPHRTVDVFPVEPFSHFLVGSLVSHTHKDAVRSQGFMKGLQTWEVLAES